MVELSIVVPMFNERLRCRSSTPPSSRRSSLLGVAYEIPDDGSTDGSFDAACSLAASTRTCASSGFAETSARRLPWRLAPCHRGDDRA
jgi:hypothetical protein